MRAIAARRSGMRCHYCGCPSAAEIEHVHPQSLGGPSHMDNLVLSCPYCNRKKAQRDVREFKASGDWRLQHPDLPGTMQEMLREFYGWDLGEGDVQTGSTNSILVIANGQAEIRVRPGRKYQWKAFRLGDMDDPRVISAAWDFLRRHYTPEKPREPRPSRRRRR